MLRSLVVLDKCHGRDLIVEAKLSESSESNQSEKVRDRGYL
jgi:hypothetical protein